MIYVKSILLLFMLTLITSLTIASYKFGYLNGYNEANIVTKSMLQQSFNRKEQEVIHGILGKYQGDFTDNNSYDHHVINELFETYK